MNMRALVTGVNSVVNRVLLAKLLEMGYEVTAQYHSDNELTKSLKAQCVDRKVVFIQADLSSKEGFLSFVEKSMDKKYDVVVNGAVFYSEKVDSSPQLDFDALQKSFAVNTTTPGVLMAHGDRMMNENSVIVNISSTFGQIYMGDIQMAMYSASKAALDLLTTTYAKRWSKNKIRVVGIAPGYMKSSWNLDYDREQIKNLTDKQLNDEIVDPKEIASLLETIIENKGFNGTTIVIDAGVSAPII